MILIGFSLPVSGFYSQYIFAKLVSQTTTDCNACLLMRPEFPQLQDGAAGVGPAGEPGLPGTPTGPGA